MAIAYRSGSSAGNASGGNLTINKPSGTTDGDVLIVTLYREAGSWTLPSGWAQVGSDKTSDGSSLILTVAYKVASSEGASWTFNLSATTWRIGVIAAFSGASSSPLDVNAGYTENVSTVKAASITTTVANAMCIVGMGNYAGNDIGAGTSGYTQGVQLGGCEIWYVIQATAGASGVKSFGSDSGSEWATIHLDIKPASGTAYTQSVSGAVSTLTGTIVKQDATTKTGAVSTITGAVSKRDQTTKAGAISTITGLVSKRDQTVQTGAVSTITGTVAKRDQTTKTGALSTIAGALTNQVKKSLAGSGTPSGSVSRRISTAISGNLSSVVGALTRMVSTQQAGTIEPTGALGAIRTVLVALSGAVTSAGNVARRIATTKAGALLSMVGGLSKSVSMQKAGTIMPTGSMSTLKSVLVFLTGVLSGVGNITKRVNQQQSGSITPAGVSQKHTLRDLVGTFTASGSLGAIRQFSRAIGGVISGAGDVLRQSRVGLVGSITGSGRLVKSIARSLYGWLNSIGLLTPLGSNVITRVVHVPDRYVVCDADERSVAVLLATRSDVFSAVDRSIITSVAPRILAGSLEEI